MDFSYDVSQTPLIGRRLLLKPDLETNVSTQAKISQPSSSNIGGTSSPRRSTSLSPADTAPLSGWKRPWMSQSRVRECLVNLLTACGQRVGLPKSPSVSVVNKLKFSVIVIMRDQRLNLFIPQIYVTTKFYLFYIPTYN